VANCQRLVERLPMAGGAAKTDRAAQRTRPTISFRSFADLSGDGSALLVSLIASGYLHFGG